MILGPNSRARIQYDQTNGFLRILLAPSIERAISLQFCEGVTFMKELVLSGHILVQFAR